MARRKRKIAAPTLPMQRQLPFVHEGRYYDLKEIFKKVKAKHFRKSLRGYSITWGQRRRQKPKTYFVFGTIQEEDRLIRIHPLLDAHWVPQWFIEYVVYHEMLHSVVPDEIDRAGRRIVHTEEFYRRERKFGNYHRARKWERENLARLLR